MPLIFALMLLCFSWSLLPANAQEGRSFDLLTKRILIEGRERPLLAFANTGEPADFSIGLGHTVMNEHGQLLFMNKDGQLTSDLGDNVFLPPDLTDEALATHIANLDLPYASAAPTIRRLRPPRVSLARRERQSIRFQARPPEAPGEYRMAVLVAQEPPASISTPAVEQGNTKVQIIPRFVQAVAYVVRVGDLHVTAGLKNLQLVNDQKPVLKGTITREGTKSLYGKVSVLLGDGEKAPEIGIMSGVGVYTEINQRHFTIPLTLPEGVQLQPGARLRVIFQDQEKDMKTGAILAEEVLPITGS